MKRYFLSAMLLFAILATPARAADPSVTSGTLTITPLGLSGRLQQYTLDWLSDAAGKVVATTFQINGTIERLVYKPDTGGTTPDDDYAITLTDADSVDVLNGTGAQLNDTGTSNTVTTVTNGTTPLPFATAGQLTLSITGAGAANGGIIRIYFRR